jgi:hypothetical protein
MDMEEILQDPKTTWEEIRLAMKSEGRHATNGGVMMSLVTALEALSKEAGHEEPHVVKMTTKPESDHNGGCLHRIQSDEMLSNSVTPMSFGYKPCNTRKPAKNNPKRFASQADGGRGKSSANNSTKEAEVTSSHASNNNTSLSVNSSLASVDVMDFGVDHDAVDFSMDTLNEIESRRGTQCNDDDESSYPTNGFLDWNHDDESSACPRQHVGPEGSGPEGSSPGKQATHTDDHEGAAGSEHQQQGRRESWHIEDYDFEPEIQHHHPVIPKMLKRLSTGTVETVSSLLSKLTHELGQGTCEPPQEATTDEVKKALDFRRAKYNCDRRRVSY